MSLEVLTVSRHAQQRYRLQHPEALPSEISFAVKRAIPIDTALSFALAGRQPREVDAEQEEHRLHVTGCGVFVICALPDTPGHGYVKTYLRLGARQQQLARQWFLDPQEPLNRAFEIGFAAGLGAAPDGSAAQAIDEHHTALSALSARLVSSTGRAPIAADIEAMRWKPEAVQQLLGHQRMLRDLSPELSKWTAMGPIRLAALRGYSHLRATPFFAAYEEPLGRVAVLVVGAPDGEPEIAATISMPNALRIVQSPPAPTIAAEATIIAAAEMEVSSWSPRAIREAREHGFAHVPVAWLSQLTPVPPEKVRPLAVALRWALQFDSTYAARRSREHVLLLRKGPQAPAGTVVRCGRIPVDMG